MNVHKNARLTPSGRALLVDRVLSGWRLQQLARLPGFLCEPAINGWRGIARAVLVGTEIVPHHRAIFRIERLRRPSGRSTGCAASG